MKKEHKRFNKLILVRVSQVELSKELINNGDFMWERVIIFKNICSEIHKLILFVSFISFNARIREKVGYSPLSSRQSLSAIF